MRGGWVARVPGKVVAAVAAVVLVAASGAVPARADGPATITSLDLGLPAGSVASVTGTGCLNLRERPGIAARVQECMAAGRSLRVLSRELVQDGHAWLKVQAGSAVGWAAMEWLAPYAGPASCNPAGRPAE